MDRPKRTRVTLKDIALECGYTANTVSRALRGDEKLLAATRMAICETARNMGYIPNSLASTLRSGTSHTVAVIVNDIRNQHFVSMLSEIDTHLRAAGYNMMILCSHLDESLAEEMIHIAISQSVDGILYFPYHSNREHIDYMVNNHMPFVLLDRWIQGVVADVARCDDEQGGYLAGQHLLGLGHRRFLYLAGVLTNSSQLDRQSGFMRALQDAHVPMENVRVVSWERVVEAMDQGWMAPVLEPRDYTAVLSFNDEIAYQVLNTFRVQGVAVPQDVSIVSFDHIRAGVPYLLPLTSVAAAGPNVAQTSVQLLLNRLRNPGLPTQIEVLPVKLFDEGTTAPPKA